MGLNKVKPGSQMYQWITHTWNPLGGACPHKCTYCSTNKLMRYPGIQNKYTGEVKLIEKELVSLGKDNFIFICGQHDLFADDVHWEYIERIILHTTKYDNEYLIQTKNPERVHKYLPIDAHNYSVCTTIETNRTYPQMGNAPSTVKRVMAMIELAFVGINTMVTIEPIMDFDDILAEWMFKLQPSQVNIGADSGNNNLPEPSKEKIEDLINILEDFTTVKIKDNLKRLMT